MREIENIDVVGLGRNQSSLPPGSGEEDLPKNIVSGGNKRQCDTFRRHTPGHCRHSRDSASVSGTQSHAGTHFRHSATLPA